MSTSSPWRSSSSRVRRKDIDDRMRIFDEQKCLHLNRISRKSGTRIFGQTSLMAMLNLLYQSTQNHRVHTLGHLHRIHLHAYL